MSILEKIKTTGMRAPRITIYGKPGIGKSTLASHFPEPLFFLTEDPSMEGIQALPICQSFIEAYNNMRELVRLEKKPFKTLVIDSVSKLDALVVKHIIDEEPRKNMAFGSCCGGYGKAYEKAATMHRAFKSLCDELNAQGITIIFVCHIHTKTERLPDTEDYSIYTIVMNHDKSREVYIDDVDAVLFGRLRSFVTQGEGERARVRSTDERILVTSVNDANVSKNRFKMPNEIDMTYEAIKEYIPFYKTGEKK